MIEEVSSLVVLCQWPVCLAGDTDGLSHRRGGLHMPSHYMGAEKPLFPTGGWRIEVGCWYFSVLQEGAVVSVALSTPSPLSFMLLILELMTVSTKLGSLNSMKLLQSTL